ncbi:MAG: single-stranded DNA-binding protein [Thermodesulfovibrio sp.]|jgi:single-strand DNA-binding protein|uniref:Single-stranded DNA-binding protein n=2 Tax=Thermodesulfovibrio TaxID=28261 RepID=A0A2J6WQG6_9BACT|nr:MAG: single-stranded DNA-binding protein [Thermodesulfovibrio aggregans]
MFNRIILIGNLTRDPEIRYTPSGVAVATVPIAVNSRYKQGEELKEETLFIDAIVFGKQAETCSQYLNKGRTVLVEGRLRERRWEYEGQKRSKFEVIANNIRFFPKREPVEQHELTETPPEEYTDLEPF